MPPLEPAQLQSHRPLRVTAEAVPTLQRLVASGAFVTDPFAEPHWPLTAAVVTEKVVWALDKKFPVVKVGGKCAGSGCRGGWDLPAPGFRQRGPSCKGQAL